MQSCWRGWARCCLLAAASLGPQMGRGHLGGLCRGGGGTGRGTEAEADCPSQEPLHACQELGLEHRGLGLSPRGPEVLQHSRVPGEGQERRGHLWVGVGVTSPPWNPARPHPSGLDWGHSIAGSRQPAWDPHTCPAPGQDPYPSLPWALTSPHSFKARSSSSDSFCPPEANSSKGSQSLSRASRTKVYNAASRSRA